MSDPLVQELKELAGATPGLYAPEPASVLDDVVHDAAASLAGSANNGGLEGQVAFLREQGWHDDDIRQAFQERL